MRNCWLSLEAGEYGNYIFAPWLALPPKWRDRTVAGPDKQLNGLRTVTWQLPLSQWPEHSSTGLHWLPVVSAFWNIYRLMLVLAYSLLTVLSLVSTSPSTGRPTALLQPGPGSYLSPALIACPSANHGDERAGTPAQSVISGGEYAPLLG